MPFVSKAQRRWMYANKPDMAKKWEKETPKGAKLPERVKEAYESGAQRALKDLGITKEANLKKYLIGGALGAGQSGPYRLGAAG